MRSRIFNACIIAVGASLLLSSCIWDRRNDCPPQENVRIRMQVDVDIDAQTRGAGIDRYEINSVWVYVFDREGHFVTSWDGGAYTHGEEYWISLGLGSGDYQFVIWTNLHEEHYTMSHTIDRLRTEMPHMNDLGIFLDADAAGYENRELHTDIADLHHGAQSATIDATKNNTVTVLIRPHTYKVNFTIDGLKPDASDYGFTVEDSDMLHSFSNTKSLRSEEPERFKYVRTTNFAQHTDNVLKASVIMVGLDHLETAPTLLLTRKDGLTRADEQLFEGDLNELIAKSYKAQNNGAEPDFDTTFEFTVPLTFDVDMGVTLDLKDWNYTENPSEL